VSALLLANLATDVDDRQWLRRRQPRGPAYLRSRAHAAVPWFALNSGLSPASSRDVLLARTGSNAGARSWANAQARATLAQPHRDDRNVAEAVASRLLRGQAKAIVGEMRGFS
jgi:hypothetical protein